MSSTTDPILRETVDALEMPRDGVRRWIQKSLQAYCLDHGGRQYYSELMDLFEEVLKETHHSS